ncbi:hypothetical protein [Polyangium sp. 6x1]|uniref:TlpA family protein disulfide reductase n=1 Tax=Polyangium sp. 6x1 TaxID=3042689 RepID=UPI002482D5AB|nr:hypothetical protein [Polyangium sp. 6x1]MDI1444366.1 hypothetical protein [Polyangium sp. 6x1]
MPAVLALHGRFGARGLRVIGVASFDPDDAEAERKAAEEAAREEKMDAPTYLDARGEWSKTAGVVDIPAFLVLGPDGRVLHRRRGKLTQGTEEFAEMERAIERALSAGSP